MAREALGLVETKGLIAAIVATDAAAKAAAVVITTAELTVAALLTIRIEGELGAVQAAVQAASEAAAKVGEVISVHVIPRPDDGLDTILPAQRFISQFHGADNRPPLIPPKTWVDERRTVDAQQLALMTVGQLRQFARHLEGFPLKGREISVANKEQLITAIKGMLGLE